MSPDEQILNLERKLHRERRLSDHLADVLGRMVEGRSFYDEHVVDAKQAMDLYREMRS